MKRVHAAAALLCALVGVAPAWTQGAVDGHAVHDMHEAHDATPDVRDASAPDAASHATRTGSHPRQAIPSLTEADRAAAVAPAAGHARHDNHWNGLLTIDRLESWDAGDDRGFGWEADAWIGTDLTRLLLKSEGTRRDGDTEHGSVELLAARSISTWWDVVAGTRHDFGTPSRRDFVSVGVQGLAPWWFHIAATAYAGSHSRSAARLQVEHDLLLTNRLILQSHLQADLAGKDDEVNAVAAGITTLGFGLRLRYEITRRVAPYAGLDIERATGDTARMRRTLGADARDTRLVFGLRTWF